jgi:hypothetical protein
LSEEPGKNLSGPVSLGTFFFQKRKYPCLEDIAMKNRISKDESRKVFTVLVIAFRDYHR